MMPPAPARVSTKNCCPKAADSRSATIRARISAAPPAANVLTMRTGRVGQFSARVGVAVASESAASAARSANCRFTGASFWLNSRRQQPHTVKLVRRWGQTLDDVMPQQRLPRIAIATGDPAGIGPEVSLKAALDPAVAAVCRTLLVGDPTVMQKHAAAAGLSPSIRVVTDVEDAAWSDDTLELLAVPFPESARLAFGIND